MGVENFRVRHERLDHHQTPGLFHLAVKFRGYDSMYVFAPDREHQFRYHAEHNQCLVFLLDDTELRVCGSILGNLDRRDVFDVVCDLLDQR